MIGKRPQAFPEPLHALNANRRLVQLDNAPDNDLAAGRL